MNDITSLTAGVSDVELSGLETYSIIAPLPVVGWSCGITLTHAQELTDYRRDRYDGRCIKHPMNAHPQFTTNIKGMYIRFLRLRSPTGDELPLAVTHSWLGSIIKFSKVLWNSPGWTPRFETYSPR